ncbi:MAG: alkaline shock response membrane anchor protein AmaP [Candidatus Bathyarchaeota archaeon]|nr:alkaline shock response membrane anchor protein AmaP [Candidatus Bathyarchaeota archaeon]MDH5419857.1 alkaline shock response membrane anchor protein AmaP [Candidatus Bathyarchaeota archaeon]MDH5623694.1 alkaline shock response membrane anchor protein AmaP [Candidatus Bathyarchaeota archaeon]MDH5636414.1 alkaline shock response membrane anchor protein AmaP [Candidatus Bathyarchaeota archaeon]MDH5702427.1 alkaline shock response membrane anchor protein AmaP [Candidatus Bathyarchaeota archaeon
MNKIAKYITAIICILIAAYGGWLVITATFPLEEWFQENPQWRTIFNLLIIVGVIGFLAAIVEAKRK